MNRRKGWLLAASAAVAVVGGAPAVAQDASPDYCARDLGQWFYCERPIEEEPKPAELN